jgi:asparagine synthase (glutamine-hydrolysing)
MVSDVPVGAFLSGGIDSSVLVALLSRKLIPDLNTFNAGFDEKGYDESHYARTVASHCGTRHHALTIAAAEGSAAAIESILGQYDQPFGDSSCVPTYLICKEISRHVKVVISGDGADELFGGYDRYFIANVMGLLRAVPGAQRLVGSAGSALTAIHPELSRKLWKISTFSTRPQSEMFCLLHTYFAPNELASLLDPDFARCVKQGGTTAERLSRFIPQEASNQASALMAMELSSILHADYLKKIDVASAAHGLEVRTPYLDQDVFGLCSTLPINLKVRIGSPKHLLRSLARQLLPTEVINRPKQGFGLPLDRWTGISMHGYLEDLLLGPLAQSRRWLVASEVRRVFEAFLRGAPPRNESRYQRYQKLFILVSFELWLRKWSPSPP